MHYFDLIFYNNEIIRRSILIKKIINNSNSFLSIKIGVLFFIMYVYSLILLVRTVYNNFFYLSKNLQCKVSLFNPMKITIGPPLDGDLEIDNGVCKTVLDIKQHISGISMIPIDHLRIFQNDVEMPNTESVENITDDDKNAYTCQVDENAENNRAKAPLCPDDFEKRIEILLNLGFSREDSIKALLHTNFKLDEAMSFLKANSSRQRPEFSKKDQHSNKISHGDKKKRKERSAWTQQDDEKLLDLYLKVAKTSIKWSYIQQYFPNCSTARLEKKYNKIIKEAQTKKTDIKLPPALVNEVFNFVDVGLKKSANIQKFDKKEPINVIKLINCYKENNLSEFSNWPKGYLIYLLYWIHLNLNIFQLPSSNWSIKELRVILDKHFNNADDDEIANILKIKDGQEIHDKINEIMTDLQNDNELQKFAEYFPDFVPSECVYDRDDIPSYLSDLFNQYLTFENDKTRFSRWVQAKVAEDEEKEDFVVNTTTNFNWTEEKERALIQGVEKFGSSNKSINRIVKINNWEVPAENAIQKYNELKNLIKNGKRPDLLNDKRIINPFNLVRVYLSMGSLQNEFPIWPTGYLRFLLYWLSKSICNEKINDRNWSEEEIKLLLEMTSNGETDAAILEKLGRKFNLEAIIDKKLEIIRTTRRDEMKQFRDYGANAMIPYKEFETNEIGIPIYFISIVNNYTNRFENIIMISDLVNSFRECNFVENKIDVAPLFDKFPNNDPEQLLFILYWLVFSLNNNFESGWIYNDVKIILTDFISQVSPDVTSKKLSIPKTEDEVMKFRTHILDFMKRAPLLDDFLSSMKFDTSEAEYDFNGIPSYLIDAVNMFLIKKRQLEGKFNWTKENEQIVLNLLATNYNSQYLLKKIMHHIPNATDKEIAAKIKEIRYQIIDGSRNYDLPEDVIEYLKNNKIKLTNLQEPTEKHVCPFETPQHPKELISIVPVLEKVIDTNADFKKISNFYSGFSPGYLSFLIHALFARMKKGHSKYTDRDLRISHEMVSNNYPRLEILKHLRNIDKPATFSIMMLGFNKRVRSLSYMTRVLDVAKLVAPHGHYTEQGVPTYFDKIAATFKRIFFESSSNLAEYELEIKLKYPGPIFWEKYQKKNEITEDELTSEDEKSEPTKQTPKKGRKKVVEKSDSSDSEEIVVKKKVGRKKKRISSSSSSQSEDQPEPIILKKKTPRKKIRILTSSSEDEKLLPPKPVEVEVEHKPKRGRPRKNPIERAISIRTDAEENETKIHRSNSTPQEAPPVQPRKRGRPRKTEVAPVVLTAEQLENLPKYWTEDRETKLIDMHNRLKNDDEEWQLIQKAFPEIHVDEIKFHIYNLRMLREANIRKDIAFSSSNDTTQHFTPKQITLKPLLKTKIINVCDLIKSFLNYGSNIDQAYKSFTFHYSKGYVVYVLFYVCMKVHFRPLVIKNWTMKEVRILLEKSYEGQEDYKICEYLNGKIPRQAEVMRKRVLSAIKETPELLRFVNMFEDCDRSDSGLDVDDIPTYLPPMIEMFNATNDESKYHLN